MSKDELLTRAKAINAKGARFVAVVAPKGGVGKTTVSMSLLVSAARAGLRVCGINMDGQHSLEKWAARRDEAIAENPDAGVPSVRVDYLEPDQWRLLSNYVECFDFVTIDTPPGHGEALVSLRAVCDVADLVLIPTTTSGMDLDEVIPFSRQLPRGRAVFVLNRVNRRTRSTVFARNALISKGRLAPVDIQGLDRIPGQFLKGLAATDLIGGAGSSDFQALWHFVREELQLVESQ